MALDKPWSDLRNLTGLSVWNGVLQKDHKEELDQSVVTKDEDRVKDVYTKSRSSL